MSSGCRCKPVLSGSPDSIAHLLAVVMRASFGIFIGVLEVSPRPARTKAAASVHGSPVAFWKLMMSRPQMSDPVSAAASNARNCDAVNCSHCILLRCTPTSPFTRSSMLREAFICNGSSCVHHVLVRLCAEEDVTFTAPTVYRCSLLLFRDLNEGCSQSL